MVTSAKLPLIFFNTNNYNKWPHFGLFSTGCWSSEWLWKIALQHINDMLAPEPNASTKSLSITVLCLLIFYSHHKVCFHWLACLSAVSLVHCIFTEMWQLILIVFWFRIIGGNLRYWLLSFLCFFMKRKLIIILKCYKVWSIHYILFFSVITLVVTWTNQLTGLFSIAELQVLVGSSF